MCGFISYYNYPAKYPIRDNTPIITDLDYIWYYIILVLVGGCRSGRLPEVPVLLGMPIKINQQFEMCSFDGEREREREREGGRREERGEREGVQNHIDQ